MQAARAFPISFQLSNLYALHIPISAESFQAAAVVFVLSSTGTFGNIGKLTATQLFNNVRHVPRFRVYGVGARPAAQRTVAFAISLIDEQPVCELKAARGDAE
jgi:hypothetical protein